MFDTPLVTTARSIKAFLQRLGADSLIKFGRNFYYSVFLKDTGHNFIRKRINGGIYKLVPSLALSADEYEPHLMAWLKEYLSSGDTFWDIGANWGFISLPAARIVGTTGRVVAVEPSPANLAWLKRHIVLNQCENIVTVIKAAVCEVNGGLVSLNLLNDGNSPSNSLMFSGSTNEQSPSVSQQIEVPAISLDSLLTKQERSPKLVKIDVEGAELKVLKGATRLLSSDKPPIIILAVHPFWQATPEDSQEIVRILKNAGYKILNRQSCCVETLEYDEYVCLPPCL
ncbi:FkbM family methyltransferase [Chlorogloeopsis sp. ULAP01]|uniref:FkbM family methyltransferase n=1 Tax=Chlorogloeopsis sp. ULAP01 TaxID=3056483 RepID=UPI0025AAC998|nr:FkbM family methyltransferase [Chlorogloeopsis sp. ULAP01]MDM9379619.1 FkbM family methyltransferase [Chlorogloeopsis sp. ULAP01]